MIIDKPMRVMWLLNHSSARNFEIPMLKRVGIGQIFLPKNFPNDLRFRSASLDFSQDQYLDIPAEDLKTLNAVDWYRGDCPDAWRIANKYFDIVFLILHYPDVLFHAARYFKGAVLWRAYGLDRTISYGSQIDYYNLRKSINSLGSRFYFCEAYSHLGDSEPDYLRRRRIFLPLGLGNSTVTDSWVGQQKQIIFVCPDIAFNSYYSTIYDDFCRDFSGYNYVIAGAQPVNVEDPRVLGYVTNEKHARNMTQSRVMFYHSKEPNHIHYHPFEAIRSGMPLVFMADGMLDRMGGEALPGRCNSIAEARHKIDRILADDWDLIEQIRASQSVLLEHMKPDHCEPAWQEGLKRISSELAEWRSELMSRPKVNRRKRVAVILPIGYRGGHLRGAIVLAKALYIGSHQWEEDADVVFLHPDDPNTYPDDVWCDFPHEIVRRPFNWKILSAAEARRAMRYAGFGGWEPSADRYMVADDGIQQLFDCDAWLIVSDRLSLPVLPIRPVVIMVYDYVQRYENVLGHGADLPFVMAARSADKVLVTTEFTYRDAIQYAGIDARKVSRVPMLAPDFPIQRPDNFDRKVPSTFFIWTTNAGPHKNHRNAAEALQIYYEELDGVLDCMLTGVNTQGMLSSDLPHLKAMANVFRHSKMLRKRVRWTGELPETQFRRLLSDASFLWHAGRIDNGTFSVIEAACLSVPSLSSDYPAMREIDAQFSLNLAWMNPDDPQQMAEQLKKMEQDASARRGLLPTLAQLEAQRCDAHAYAYWQEVRVCL